MHQVKFRGSMLIEFEFPAMFPSSKATLDVQDKARRFMPMVTSEMPPSFEAAVRFNKKRAPLVSSAGNEGIPTQK